MQDDRVCLNGTLLPTGQLPAPDTLLSSNYLYQSIHTFEHRPLHLAAHTEIIEKSYRALYGGDSGLDEATLRGEIESVLAANRYPRISNRATLCLFPPEEPGKPPVRLVSCAGPMLYKGYVMWHTRPQATVRSYGFPATGHATGLSRIGHGYVWHEARREGFDAVLREQEGVLVDAGEYPLFGVRSGVVCTAPLESGATDSVPRRIVYRLCELAGIDCVGEPLAADAVASYDELFYMTPQGLVSLLSCNGHLLFNLTTLRLGGILEKLDPADYDMLL